MSTYQKAKNAAREKAIAWSLEASDKSYSYGELLEWQAYFEKLAKRYGLTEEFQEEGII